MHLCRFEALSVHENNCSILEIPAIIIPMWNAVTCDLFCLNKQQISLNKSEKKSCSTGQNCH